MRTFSQRKEDVDKRCYVIDATDAVLGRLASFVAFRLRGKHKPEFTPHVDCGDRIIIVNADKVALTGRKREEKVFHWHTGYPGGVKSRTARQTLEGRFPERLFYKAVERMITRGPLGRLQMRSLFVYSGREHKHAAQKPEVIDFAAMNAKNVRHHRGNE